MMIRRGLFLGFLGEQLACLGVESILLCGGNGAPVQETLAESRHKRAVQTRPGLPGARESEDGDSGDIFLGLLIEGSEIVNSSETPRS